MTRVRTVSADETRRQGAALGARLAAGDVVTLTGTLGAGKTQFAQGICDALGVDTHVSSPTFTLINEYHGARGDVAHIDLYRLTRPEELPDLGLEDYLAGDYICLIEWPELISPLLPDVRCAVTITHGSHATEREIAIEGGGW